MWIDRQTLDEIKLAAATSVAKAQVLAEQNRALQVSFDWARVRITQLEIERAQLLFNYTGVKVPTPSIERAPDPTGEVARALQAVQGFQDIGDNEAERLGIGWNQDGSLRTAKE